VDRDDLQLYGVEVEISFVDRLRGMLRFDSIEDLVEAMHGDVARTREIVGS
jgi:riboflavin kinase / FMN adenylyltransferase